MTSPSCLISTPPCRAPNSHTGGILSTGHASGCLSAREVRRMLGGFDVEPCYVFHPMNAYDDGDSVLLDVVRHQRMFDTHPLGPDEGPPTLERWSIDLTTGKVAEERLDDRG